MIRRLVLENWRNYRHADVVLTGGTTFVVASNGVGKTSFVEAARWALFGSAPATNPARMGTTRTSATVELVLPDHSLLEAVRVWDSRKTKPAHQLTLTRDGQHLEPHQWDSLCVQQFGCSLDLLERLTMPTPAGAAPSGLGLHAHLSSLYRVDDLSAAAVRLAVELRVVAKEISNLKTANALKAGEFDALQARVHDAEVRLAEKKAEVEDAERQLNLARLRDNRLERTAALLRERREIEEEQLHLRHQVSELVGESIPADRLLDVLLQRSRSARSNLEALRLELQLVARRREDIERDLTDLDAAVSECPTCRRPLDSDARQHAHVLWRTEKVELDQRESAARRAEQIAAERVATLEYAERELASIERRASAVLTPPEKEEVAVPSSDEATQVYRAAVESEAMARDSHRRSQEALVEARAAERSLRRLELLFTREARLEMAKGATETTRDEILSGVVTPLAEAINARWSSLFPDRGSVTTDPDGTISRRVGEHTLPFDAFSTAEGTAALIIMRLLVAQMTTKATFAWFDEPLEHLDPDVRRNVASLLTKVAGSGSLDQVVITTYEETLARRLQERSPSTTKLIDVRQEGTI